MAKPRLVLEKKTPEPRVSRLISSNFKGLAKHDPNKWRHFISVNEMLDQLEESVVELDFE